MAFFIMGTGRGIKEAFRALASICQSSIGSVLRERRRNSTSITVFFVLLSVYFCDTPLQEHGG
jgi:hypothetical protein